MATEKILNTRIVNKHAELITKDGVKGWDQSTLKLKEGEIALAKVTVAEQHAGGKISEVPAYLVKIGVEGKTFNETAWAYAKAADVYAWAKQENLPVKETGSGNAITKIEYSTWTENDKTIYGILVTKGTTFATQEELEGYKTKQTAYSAAGSTIKTVTKVEQNANGEVTVTYENIDFPELPDENDFGVLTVNKKDGTAIEVDNTNAQNPKVGFIIDSTSSNANGGTAVKLSQSNNGLKAEVDLSNFATKEYVSSNEKDTKTTVSAGTLIDVELTTNNKEFKENSANNYKVSVNEAALKTLIGQETTAAMEFKGATASLPTSAVKGDMYKISGEFTVEPAKDAQDEGFTAKVGDSIVYDGAKWYLIPSGDDIEDTWRTIKVDNVSIPSTDTLDLVSTEKIELKTSSLNGITHVEIYHKAAPSDSYSTNGIALNHGDSFTVVEESFDAWGHLNGGVATTYTLPALPTPEDIGAAKPGDIGNGKLAITTESGVLTGSVDFTANQKTNNSITIGVAAKGITTAKIADKAITTDKIADHAVGAAQIKAEQSYTGEDAEVWVFDCGGAE
ncbi:MAG: hypothetical protein J6A25_00825 [Lachnospiraceae bacterium]|nr:hypothetical protein [Lachnospiraceae bacterium]